MAISASVRSAQPIRRAQPWLGTFVEIAASGSCDLQDELQNAVEAAFDAVAQVHRLMSFHDAESDVSRINRQGHVGPVAVHPWTYQVLETALELNRRSDGCFDVAAAPLLQRRGLLPRDADISGSDISTAVAGEAIELLGENRVRCRNASVKIDLGGIAKGFAVDRAIEVLCSRGIGHGVVNAGGDLAVFGPAPEWVQIRNPKAAHEILCAVEIANAALASSGRVFDPHRSPETGETAVFDPNTRGPVRAIAGATVRAPSCMIADALTKVVMIASENAAPLLQDYGASALLMLESGDVRITPDWQDAVRVAA
jgi:thiamine biosynthesis lipoprotein